jgi:hypothetical protein
MRVLGNLSDLKVLQVEKTPELADPVDFNGKFIIPIPAGAKVDVDSSSYITPVDGSDLSSLAQAGLLAQYPQYGTIVFNPLLTSADVADLDLTALGPGSEKARVQTGRGAGPAATGQAPCMTAILRQNGLVTPARPGCVVTDTIDISAATSGVGADEFMVWWQIYDFGTSQDVVSGYGATAGQNTPALKAVTEIDQEPTNFEVHLSINDGIAYTKVGRLEPVGFCVKSSLLRLAFINRSTVARRYLCAYSIMF